MKSERDLETYGPELTRALRQIIKEAFPDSSGTLYNNTVINVKSDGSLLISTTDYFKYVNEKNGLIEKFKETSEFQEYKKALIRKLINII